MQNIQTNQQEHNLIPNQQEHNLIPNQQEPNLITNQEEPDLITNEEEPNLITNEEKPNLITNDNDKNDDGKVGKNDNLNKLLTSSSKSENNLKVTRILKIKIPPKPNVDND